MQHTSPQQRGPVASSGMLAAFNRATYTTSSRFPMLKVNRSFSQFLAFTSYGPVYRGTKLGFPSLSSLTNTNLAVLKDFATMGDSLKRRKSNVSGRNAAAFDRARSSFSLADRFDGCASWKHMPGTGRGVPYNNSAVEVAVSPLGAFRKPSRTHGSDLIHDLLDRMAHRRESFRAR